MWGDGTSLLPPFFPPFPGSFPFPLQSYLYLDRKASVLSVLCVVLLHLLFRSLPSFTGFSFVFSGFCFLPLLYISFFDSFPFLMNIIFDSFPKL